MARYNTFRYSDEKYGASASQDRLVWGIEVDWNNDNIWSGDNEDSYVMGLRVERGRKFIINNAGDGFEMVSSGTCTLTLDNSSRRYDPYYLSGPLYGQLLPGRALRVRVRDMNTGTVYPIFHGRIVDIRPITGKEEQVTIQAEEQWSGLLTNEVDIDLVEDRAVEDAIGDILDDVSWPVSDRSIEVTGADFIPWWWVVSTTARTVLEQLMNVWMGSVFIAADGIFTYFRRDRVAASVVALVSRDLLKEIRLLQPWEVVRNSVKITAHPRTEENLGVLWSLGDQPLIQPGASLELWADYTYNGENVPASSVTDPVATTDYTMNNMEDGTGIDLTSSLSVVHTRVGGRSKLVVTNNHASSSGFITLLQLRGTAVSSQYAVFVEKSDTASVAIYQTKKISIDNQFIQDAANATDLADYLLAYLATAQIFPTVRLVARPDIQFIPDLFDRIDLTITAKNIDGTYEAGNIVHEWLSPTGQAVATEWMLEPEPDFGDLWIFTTNIGTTSYFAF